MSNYVFRVWLLPNPPLKFEPDEEVWRDIDVDGTHTLAEFHEAIFEAFERWDSHAYEFITRDEDGIALRCYVHPQLYDGGPSWRAMDDAEIDRFIDQVVPQDASEDAKRRFRDLQSDPPTEGNAADTTIGELDPETLGAISYTFDMGDGWEHYIELQDTREGSLDDDPAVVDEQGDAPPQYPDLDDEQ
ncbi:IS1096 element passenger TnpR family protein [Natrialbaceae archaeon A-CW1-1]